MELPYAVVPLLFFQEPRTDGKGPNPTRFEHPTPLNRQRNWSFRSNRSENLDHRRHQNKNSYVDPPNNISQDNDQVCSV